MSDRPRCGFPILQPEGTHRGCVRLPHETGDHEYHPVRAREADDADSAAPQWVHAIVTALITGEPLDFHGEPVPADIVRRLVEAFDEKGSLRPRPSAGMLAAVQRDLARIDTAKVPGGYTHAAIAVWLAGVIDKRGTDDGPSMTAKLAAELGKAMAALTRTGGTGDDGFDGFSEDLSIPVVE
jgi:hypothetical protein